MKSKASEVRGREARLRADFDYLYPGVQANTWVPVERLIHDVVTLLYGDGSKSGYGIHRMHEVAVGGGEFHQGFRGLPGLTGVSCSARVPFS